MSDTFKNGKFYDSATDTDVQDMTGVSIDWIQRQAADRMREMQARRARAIDTLLRRWCRAGRQASSGVEGRHEE